MKPLSLAACPWTHQYPAGPGLSIVFPGPRENLSFMSKRLFIFSLFYLNKNVLFLFLSFPYSVVGIKISSMILLTPLLWFPSLEKQVIRLYYPFQAHTATALLQWAPSTILAHVLAASPTCLLSVISDFNTHANHHLCPDRSGPRHTLLICRTCHTSHWAPHRSQPW